MSARRLRLASVLAILAALVACDITSVSGPTQALVGDLVTFMVGFGAGGIHGTLQSKSAFVAADVPMGWTATSATYTGTVNGQNVFGNAAVSSSDPGGGGGLPAVAAGYTRIFFAAGPWPWVTGDDNGTGTIVFHVGGSAGTYTLAFRAATEGGTWSTPKTRDITVSMPCAVPSAPTAAFTWSPATATVGHPVTFTDSSTGSPSSWAWTFGDGMTSAVQHPTHSYPQPGTYATTLTATNCKGSSSTSRGVIVTCGEGCAADSVIVPDVVGSTPWRTDLRVLNPSGQVTQVWLGAMPAGQDNADQVRAGPYTLPAWGTLVLDDVEAAFASLAHGFAKAALRITFQNPDGATPVALARTYAQVAGGGTVGESVAGVPVWTGTTPSPQWLVGGRSDGEAEGYRTNVTLANLRGQSPPGGVAATVLDGTGTAVASRLLSLPPYGYMQWAFADLFGPGLSTMGMFTLRLDLPPGSEAASLASVVDNRTGDPATFPSQGAGSGTVFIPNVVHGASVGGGFWRSPARLTNPERAAQAWEVRILPVHGLPVVSRQVSLLPGQSFETDDLVAWLYSPLEPGTVTGLVRVTPTGGSVASPLVAASVSCATAGGTVGSGLPAVGVGAGATPSGTVRHLYLTGMSSPDIARTNLGLVNLAEGPTDFSILLYDESGSLLNPGGRPYTFAMSKQGLDCNPIEALFQSAFGTPLPSNLRVISADVRVTSGGPGWAYATVFDAASGDPAVFGARSIVAAPPVPSCAFTIAPASASFPAAGGAGSFTLSTQSGCSWAAVADSSWLILSAGLGTGSATVGYSVAANVEASARSGAIVVAGQAHAVTQEKSPCTTPAAPLLTAPSSATSEVPYTVSWTATSPISTYELQEAADSVFTSPATIQVSALSRSFSHTATDPTSFFYRARAVGTCNSTSVYSTWSATGQTAVVPLDAVLYVPAGAHLGGVGGTNWRTDLEVHNPGTSPARFALALLRRDQQNTSPTTQTFSLDPGKASRYGDVLSSLFAFTGAATLRITPLAGEIMASSRTYNQLAAGNAQGLPEGSTFGQFIPGAVATTAVSSGQSARLVQLAQSASASEGFRTNLGLVNVTAVAVTVEVRLHRWDSTALGTLGYTLPAFGYKQIDRIFTYVTTADVPDGFAVLRTTTPDGAFFAYVSVIDNRSGDPIFIPAQVVDQ